MWPLVPKVSASDIHALIEVMQEQINSLDCESSFILSEPYSSRKTDRGDEFIGIEENTTETFIGSEMDQALEDIRELSFSN